MSILTYHRILAGIAVYALAVLAVLASVSAVAQTNSSRGPQAKNGESSNAAPPLMRPEELAQIVQSSKGPKPLVLYVGYRVLYLQAHIPHSEYIGPASEAEGMQRLRKRVEALPHKQLIVVYCGCCPWSQCPNMNPAYRELRGMGFSNVKLLYIETNFGKDWVDKSYPVAKGE